MPDKIEICYKIWCKKKLPKKTKEIIEALDKMVMKLKIINLSIFGLFVYAFRHNETWVYDCNFKTQAYTSYGCRCSQADSALLDEL